MRSCGFKSRLEYIKGDIRKFVSLFIFHPLEVISNSKFSHANIKVVGMALFYPRYSTWKGPTFHLEDLIVTESMKGKGIGTQLYIAFLKYANEAGVERIEWAVLDWNLPAINFYQKSGADVLDYWKTVQMDKQSIENYISKINL